MLNKSVLRLALVALTICSNSSANPISTDPFIQEWDYFDGIQTYRLNITQSPAPGQDYHIDYTFLYGRSATDMCVVTSNTSFHCSATGETVSRDDNHHSVTVTSSNYAYLFYDPGHMPPVSTIFGNWTYHFKDNNYEASYTISVMRGSTDMEYKVLTSSSDSRGNQCYRGEPDVYQVMRKENGIEEIMFDESIITHYSFKYDSQNNQIVKLGKRDEFYAGPCVTLGDKDGTVVFTKN